MDFCGPWSSGTSAPYIPSSTKSQGTPHHAWHSSAQAHSKAPRCLEPKPPVQGRGSNGDSRSLQDLAWTPSLWPQTSLLLASQSQRQGKSVSSLPPLHRKFQPSPQLFPPNYTQNILSFSLFIHLMAWPHTFNLIIYGFSPCPRT